MSDTHVTTEQLSLLIDGELALTERAAVLDHVEQCPSCAAEQARLVEVSAALRSAPAGRWTKVQTIAVGARLRSSSMPPARAVARHRSARVAALLVAALTLAGVAAFIVEWPYGPLIAGALWHAFSWLPPMGTTGAVGAGLMLLAISLVAPLVAYPLARWR
ncbi:MAG TPA: zf-HC2 domain-containing protein [Microbacteriaceae bacterium]|nr:zf-HC2 domain-containing protein [Microbacteriaceae bacterium]